MPDANRKARSRSEQNYVIVLADGTIFGTPSGGPLTRDAAWLTERWYSENKPELEARAVQIGCKPEEE